MRKLALTIVSAALALALTGTANASITIDSITPGTDPYAGPAPTYDFDTNTPTTNNGAVVTGSSSSHAQPFGSTGNYYSVGPDDSTPGTIDLSGFGDIGSISLIWGSVDSYNTLEFLDAANNVLATFSGNDIFNPANGNQTDPNTNPVVTFMLDGSSVSDFTTLRLTSDINAFEIDNIAVRGVPEPATWAMMLLGFGAVGFALRRRRTADKVLPQLA
jgi:PEP-CTERM motif